ncbi:MAG: hypothetical protein AB1467_06730 [Candidatus Diapherotrites archaeon]
MKLFGLEITKNGTIQAIKKQVDSLESQLALTRPNLDELMSVGGEVRIPSYPLPASTLYEISLYSDILRNIHLALKGETFRNGYSFKTLFEAKCIECGKEFDYKAIQCDECAGETRQPLNLQLQKIKEFLKKCNENKQSLIEVLEQLEDDLNIMDDAYLLINKKYYFNELGEIIAADIKEILRVPPHKILIYVDRKGNPGRDLDGRKVYVCPEHRTELKHENGYCSKCQKKLYEVFYASRKGRDGTEPENYYIEDEIIHVSKYSPSLSYGFPTVLTIWQKAVTLMNMDKYVKDYYGKQRPPKGLFLVNTRNKEGLVKTWEELLKNLEKNPHLIWPLAVESNSTKGQVAQFINFMQSLEDMQYIEARNEMRRTIGALYGVMPLFQGDTSVSGGLNNEGLQITVTNRAVERGQRIYNEKIFPELLRQFGVTDWKLELNPSEEKDEMAELQRENLKIQNARLMLDMGFDVELTEQKEFKFSGEASRQEMIASPLMPEQTIPSESTQRFQGEPSSIRMALEEIEKFTGEKKIQGREKELEEKLLRELEEFTVELDYKKKPSKEQLKKTIKKLSERLSKKLVNASERELKKIYEESIKDIEKQLGTTIGFSEVDENALNVIKKQEVFTEAYSNMNSSISKKLNEIISEAYAKPEEFTIKKIMDKMKETISEEDYKLERIARTETNHVSNIARMNSYMKADPKGEFKYKWIGPDDYRTTELCKELKQKTSNGVTLKELKELIKSTSNKYGFEARDFTPHVNCRHSYIRKV